MTLPTVSDADRRNQMLALVLDLERQMLALPQQALEVRHYFSDGIYARELRIPAGTALTGAMHLTRNLNILSQGEISVLTETGVQRIQAPATIVSPPGTKRIAYAHTDCVWTTIHATELTDIDAIRNQFVADIITIEHAGDPEWLGQSAQ